MNQWEFGKDEYSDYAIYKHCNNGRNADKSILYRKENKDDNKRYKNCNNADCQSRSAQNGSFCAGIYHGQIKLECTAVYLIGKVFRVGFGCAGTHGDDRVCIYLRVYRCGRDGRIFSHTVIDKIYRHCAAYIIGGGLRKLVPSRISQNKLHIRTCAVAGIAVCSDSRNHVVTRQNNVVCRIHDKLDAGGSTDYLEQILCVILIGNGNSYSVIAFGDNYRVVISSVSQHFRKTSLCSVELRAEISGIFRGCFIKRIYSAF